MLAACVLLACGSDTSLSEKVPPPEPSETASAEAASSSAPSGSSTSSDSPSSTCQRTVKADVVALDQAFTYNRFGAFNPIGMVYALRRDVEAIEGNSPGPGNARLRDGKRPRPLVLRVNKGDCLKVTFTNWLAPNRGQIPEPPEVPSHVPSEDLRNDAPATRVAGLHVQGLQYLNIDADAAHVGRNEDSLAEPGQTREYRLFAEREGTYLFRSMAHLLGGEGDNAALAAGFFGAVHVEPKGSRWFRSQVTAEELQAATKGRNSDGTPRINYEAKDKRGVPILEILGDGNEIVHGDLYAIVANYKDTELGTPTSQDVGVFREFTAVFHDEIKVVQAFPELEDDPTLRAIRDGFAINYGSDALGPRLLANRARIGPSAKCFECKFEEFFLSSWPNGDPALNLERDEDGKAERALFPEDPSNVHHAYLGDPVRIRNMHAGPKEAHIFHLHSHQWLHSPRDDESTYLDSQTISPGSTFIYDINFGGGGNRNLTVGDAIFHCHFYPHFAQGMWSLWRNHDVFEAGTPDRNLPDGELARGVPTPALVPLPGRAMPPMPTYKPTQVTLANGETVKRPAFPGYPFFIASVAGRRAAQPPLDLEVNGGLPRHLVVNVPPNGVVLGERGEFDVTLEKADLKLLPDQGTPAEQVAMDFHAGEFEGGENQRTLYGFPAAAYPAFTPEGKRASFFVNGQPPKPGAPYADPCPKGTKERDYRVAFVQLDMVVNRAGWHDPQARIFVLNDDVQATLSGERPPEPLVMRANSGECVVSHGTNLIPDALEEDAFQIFAPTDTLGQHIHLVKFDVTSSDGSVNGWNYEDGTFAAQEVQMRIAAANARGGAFKADGTTKPGGPRQKLTARPHPLLPFAPLGTQTTVQRWWADPIVNDQGEDRTVQTSFTHDHFSPSSMQQHGFYASLAVEPKGSRWRDPETGVQLGTRDDGGPTRWRADILTPKREDSFREFPLAVADFALVFDDRGEPINVQGNELQPLPRAIANPENPPPLAISSDDPGSMLLNYRNEPIPLRIAQKVGGTFVQRQGPAGDMANVFRSDVHGDPFTPLMRAYGGDKVLIRLTEGAQEEMHSLSINGVRWLHEPADKNSGFANAQAFGISEHFELADRLPPVQGGPTADFLYNSAPADDLWNGVWGLIRTYRDTQPDLLELPGNPIHGRANAKHPTCPEDAPLRRYTVYALTARGNLPGGRLVYNERFRIFDPDAILYVLAEHVDDVIRGRRRPEPLILRAAAGDCIEVKLVNALPEVLPKTPHWNFLPVITEGFNVNQVASSNQASLHPQLVDFNVREGDSANVGLNPVQTVAPGKVGVYRWYAGRWKLEDDESVSAPVLLASLEAGGSARERNGVFEPIPVEYGAINLRDMADVVNHGTQSVLGALIIEPRGATWKTDPGTHAQATVSYRDKDGKQRKFREFVLLYQDELGLHSDDPRFQCEDAGLQCGTALLTYGATDDAEESGHKAFNLRTEPLWARLGLRPENALVEANNLQQADLLSSKDFGEPATPIFTAKDGDEVRFRVLQASGHPRSHAFTLHGHEWQHEPWVDGSSRIGDNEESNIVGTQGGHAPMRHWNVVPENGAGGKFRVEGDYLYQDQPSVLFPEGMWGIFRVE
ncbi:copper oxidase [Hyalangium minutum]|uniref:Multicopper oxidase n=1 Tax=Hyalangium minutum TaxID=394096 RepID=A0A085W982_9BACT|nr:copper oxidase [Hyalangium minutum]KFE64245.1 hypothetical protein DB31_2039 [Hyalangium minutum]